MSDLQNELDMLDNLEPMDEFDVTDIRNIVEAARLVADGHQLIELLVRERLCGTTRSSIKGVGRSWFHLTRRH